MLGSDIAGERAAAAHKATEFLKARKMTWNDVIRQPAGPQPQPKRAPPPPHWTEIPKTDMEWLEAFQMECWDLLSDWERQFVEGVIERNHWPLSPKQRNVVLKMKEKYCQTYA
jgi:hypothetical protein